MLTASSSIARKAWGARSLGILAFTQGFATLARVLGYFPGHRVGWGCPIARQVVLDWAAWCRTNRFRGTDGTDFEPGLAKIALPVLSVSFSDDRILGAKAPADVLADLVKSSQPQRWHLRPEEVDKKDVGHFGFLRDCPTLWQRIDRWLVEHSA